MFLGPLRTLQFLVFRVDDASISLHVSLIGKPENNDVILPSSDRPTVFRTRCYFDITPSNYGQRVFQNTFDAQHPSFLMPQQLTVQFQLVNVMVIPHLTGLNTGQYLDSERIPIASFTSSQCPFFVAP